MVAERNVQGLMRHWRRVTAGMTHSIVHGGITPARTPQMIVTVEPRLPSTINIDSPTQDNDPEPVIALSERISAVERVLTHHAEFRTLVEQQLSDHELRLGHAFDEFVKDKLAKVARDVAQQHEQLGGMTVAIAKTHAKHKKHIDDLDAEHKGHHDDFGRALTQPGATAFELNDAFKTSYQHVQPRSLNQSRHQGDR